MLSDFSIRRLVLPPVAAFAMLGLAACGEDNTVAEGESAPSVTVEHGAHGNAATNTPAPPASPAGEAGTGTDTTGAESGEEAAATEPEAESGMTGDNEAEIEIPVTNGAQTSQ